MGPHRVFGNELMSPTIASAGNPMSRMSVASLGYQALIPERNLVRPAPNHFTHELVVDEPYHFDRPDQLDEPRWGAPGPDAGCTAGGRRRAQPRCRW